MKTHELIHGDEKKIVPVLRNAKIKELEAHSTKMLAKLGCREMEKVLAALIKLMPRLPNNGESQNQVKSLIAEQVMQYSPLTSLDAQILDRLAVVMTLLVAKKFEKIHKETHGGAHG